MFKKLLLALFATTAVANSPMIWDSAEFGKMLTSLGFKLEDEKQYRTLSVDPSVSGVTAAVGSIGVRNNGGAGEVWLKTGSGNTSWSQVVSGSSGPYVLKAGDTMTGRLRVNSSIQALSDVTAGLAGVSSGTLATCTSGSNCGSFAQVTNGESRIVGPSSLTLYSGGNERLAFSSGGAVTVTAPSWPFTMRAGDTMTGSLGLNYSSVTPDRAAYVDGSRILRTSTSVSSQELEYLDGLTANIQAQLNAGGGGGFVLKTGDTMTGSLVMDSGTAIQVGNINNTSGATVMNVDNIQFYDSSSVLSIDGQNRTLKSLAGDQKFNWDTGVYSHDNGVTMLDAERGILGSFGLTGVTSLSWTTRELFSSNGGRVAQWGTGTSGLDINLDGGTITSVPAPVSANDAVNKQYVDDAIAGVSIPDGTYVRISGDTMTGNLGTQQVRIPFGSSPGTILYGNDTDTGPYQTGDGEYYIAANSNPRLHVSQNYSEFLGPVTANSNVDIGGTLTAASINYPAGSLDLTTDVTGVLPIANGGTGASTLGATGTIPFNGSGGTLETDWASLNYSPDSGRLTVPQIFSNQTITSVTSAISYESLRFEPVLSGTFAYITPGAGIGATLQGVSLQYAAQSFDFANTYEGDNLFPNGVLDFNIHNNFQNNTGYIGGYKGLTFWNSFNDHDYITLVDSNNVVGVTSEVANYNVFDMHDQVLAGATVNNYSALNHSMSNSGGIGSYIGINDQPNFIVSPSSYIGINIAAQGGVTVSYPIALNLSTDNLYSSTAFNRPKAINHNGKGVIEFTTVTTLPNSHPSVVDSINNMVSVVRTEPGSPLSGTGSLGWNFGGFIDAQANVSLDPIGAGINAAGWVSLVGISSGVTVAQAGGTISVPVNATGTSSGATGGHLSAFKHYQAFPFFPQGGSNTLGDNWGFSVPSGFCGGITGDCYGIHLGDTGAKSYLAGPVTLGLASDTVPYLDGATTLVSSSVSGTELGYLNGVTASLQTQINAIMSTNSSQDAEISSLQGATATQAAQIAALQGVTLNTWLPLVGGTLSGSLLVDSTISSVTHDINPIRSNGGISALGGLWSGNANNSGGGGALRLRRDTGVEGWRIALGGSAGDSNLTVRDVQNAVTLISVTTAKQVQFGTAGTRLSFEHDASTNTSLQTVALSGASTFISNTTITANSYPFMLSQGTNVSPYLIGLTTGVGYSVGATGAGTAKVFIVEGQ